MQLTGFPVARQCYHHGSRPGDAGDQGGGVEADDCCRTFMLYIMGSTDNASYAFLQNLWQNMMACCTGEVVCSKSEFTTELQ
jgi:hypothetical protein